MSIVFVDPDPDKIIADAEQEATEAENLVVTLEEAVRSGDDTVTYEAVEKARGLLSFVRLRKEAATRKAAAAKEAARLQACEALHADITAHAKGDGAQLSKKLKAAFDALNSFHDAVEERNARIRDYRQRAFALGIPEIKHSAADPATHGGVRLAANGGPGMSAGVIIGRRRVDGINAKAFMNGALNLLQREGKFEYQPHDQAGDDLFGDLARIDADAPEDSAKYFYRGPNGGVFRKDEPFAPEEIQRHRLTVISKAVADAE
jgi:hypothetical protein